MKMWLFRAKKSKDKKEGKLQNAGLVTNPPKICAGEGEGDNISEI